MTSDDGGPHGSQADTGAGASDKKQQQQPAKESNKREIKILMLHGLAQSGPLFHAKTRTLEKLLASTLGAWDLKPTLIYPTGPTRILRSEVRGFVRRTQGSQEAEEEEPPAADSWAWFRRDAATGAYHRLLEGMRAIADHIREAHGVDAVVGFSQGGLTASLVAAALELDRPVPFSASKLVEQKYDLSWVAELRDANAHRPLRFAVFYSGFPAGPGSLRWLLEPPIKTPTLHFIGRLDTVVDPARSRLLAACCVDPVVIEHPGGHHVPVSKQWTMPLLGFIKERLVDGEHHEHRQQQRFGKASI